MAGLNIFPRFHGCGGAEEDREALSLSDSRNDSISAITYFHLWLKSPLKLFASVSVALISVNTMSMGFSSVTSTPHAVL